MQTKSTSVGVRSEYKLLMLGFGVLRFAQHEGKGGEEEKGRAYLVGDRRRQRGGGRRAADRQVVAARKEDQGRGETEREGKGG